MAEFIELQGGRPLTGQIRASGAKNAALPILIASLLTSEECIIRNVPNLEDVNLTLRLLEHFGGEVCYSDQTIRVSVPRLLATEASYSLVKALRASFWALGPLLARGGAARVALPGGDIIGARPVDMHLDALQKMGAEIRVKHGVVFASAADGLRPAELDFRFPSVGATHQVMMAASRVVGTTVIRGAAREPEVVALASFLSALGADIEGAGSGEIIIRGAENLEGVDFELIGDRIETATYLLAGVATGGNVTVDGINPSFLGAFLETLDQMGVGVSTSGESISVKSPGTLRPVTISTSPFPGFATDIQAPLMAALCMADGESVIEENVFEGRYGHVSELCRMGANITVDGRIARIHGPQQLSGAPVEALDIRAGAAVIIAGLAAEGTTCIFEPQHLRRGYARLEEKISRLGGVVGRKIQDPEDYLFTGC